MGWYFRVGDLTQGPISAERMRRFALQGKLRPDHKVSSDKHHWFRADQVFEFGSPSRPQPTADLGDAPETRPARRGFGLPLAIAGLAGLALAAFAAWRLLG